MTPIHHSAPTPRQRFITAQTDLLEHWGVDATSLFVDIPVIDGQAHVLRRPAEGPPVLLVNGIGTPAAMFAALMAKLDGFDLYAVDLPGFGLTDPAPHLTSNVRRLAVDFLSQVVEELGLDRSLFVSNSLGSQWVTWLALDQPGQVVAMVHIGCPALWLHTSAPLPMRLLSVPWLGRLLMRAQQPSPAQVRQLSKMVNEHPLPPDVAKLLLATEQLPHFQEMFLALLRTLLRLRGASPSAAMHAQELACVTQPVQLIWGQDDPFGGPDIGRQAAALLPHGHLHVVPGGHAPWLRSSVEIGGCVASFLGSTTRKM